MFQKLTEALQCYLEGPHNALLLILVKASFNLATKNDNLHPIITQVPNYSYFFSQRKKKKARDSRVLHPLWCPNIPRFTSIAGVFPQSCTLTQPSLNLEIKNIIPFVISFFALYYICLIKKSYFINASDLRLHDVLFCDHLVGEAEVTTEIS